MNASYFQPVPHVADRPDRPALRHGNPLPSASLVRLRPSDRNDHLVAAEDVDVCDKQGTKLGSPRADDACEHARLREAGALLHGGEAEVWGDSSYRGIERWVETGGRDVKWTVAMAPGRRSLLDPKGPTWRREREKASVRAKGEHPFLYLKRHFGYRKVRYRGLAKNTERIALLLGFSNLLIAGRYATA